MARGLTRTLLATACLAAASLSGAQVVTNPNQVVGSIEWTNEDPAIVAALNAPTDSPPGLGEGMSNVDVYATSLPPQSPTLNHQTTRGATGSRRSAYEITVEAGPAGSGIAYGVRARVRTRINKYYQFASVPSPPVEAEPAPDVVLDIEECATLVEVRWQFADGTPAFVGDGDLEAYREDPPGSGRYSTWDPQAWGGFRSGGTSVERLAIRGDGTNYLLHIEYELGSDPFSDTLRLVDERWITAPCDEIVPIVIVIEYGGPIGGIPFPQIVGRFDVLRESEWRIADPALPLTLMWAERGPFDNRRLDWLDAVPSSGAFRLINVAPSDMTNPETGYIVGGAAVFRSGRRFQRFVTPQLDGSNGRVFAHAPDIVDMGDTFVIDPGYVRGDILLSGPPSAALPEGPSLADIRLHDPAADIPASLGLRPDTDSQRFTYYLDQSCVSGTGTSTVAPGATKSAAGGKADAGFDGVYDVVGSAFAGDYELVLGGLHGEPSEWDASGLAIGVLDESSPENPASYHRFRVTVDDDTARAVLVEPGATTNIPRHYCFSEVRVRFAAGAGTFVLPELHGSGALDGIDFEGRPADYGATVWALGTPRYADPPGIAGLVSTSLPQGSYDIRPRVSEANPGGGFSLNDLQRFDLVVGCRQIVDISTDLQLVVDNLPICSIERILRVTGRVQGDSDVARIAWSLNGAPEQVACTDCGLNPEYAFDVNLADCDNTLVVTASDAAGNVATVTAFTRLAGSPITVTGCADIRAHAPFGSTEVAVTWTDPTAADGCSGPVPVTCLPASGAMFPIGDTEVVCEASDACDARGECRFTVTVDEWTAPPPVADAGPDRAACSGGLVVIGGAPTATSGVPPYTYSWSPATGLDDPTAANPVATLAGVVTYTVTVTDSLGQVASDSCALTLDPSAPTAAFTVPPGPSCEDQPICFTNVSAGAIEYEWDFGTSTGDASGDASPCFAYPAAGTYTVTLTAISACGRDTATAVVIVDPKPVADFAFDVGTNGCVGSAVSFDDTSTGSPTSWQWEFGDGTTSTEQDPSHAYSRDGIYIVSLVACNDCGCSDPHYEAVEIAASCNTNCEANSNQVGCGGSGATQPGDTCTDHDSFNTTSYPCAPGIFYSGENKIYDLNFPDAANFLVRLVETIPEPNGYDLDLMVSTSCNPPETAAWGDELVLFDDRTARNDDYWVIVDGRDGSCGPFRLEVQCLDPVASAACRPPDFAGIVSARDADPCTISGILLSWDAAAGWGAAPDGAACVTGSYDVWRAPASDPTTWRNVGSSIAATAFLDRAAVPGRAYVYRIDAVNACCAEPAITTATVIGTDLFADPLAVDAGSDRVIACGADSVRLLARASGGSGGGLDVSWTPSAPLSDPTTLSPVTTQPGTFTLTITDRQTGCTATDVVEVTLEGAGTPQEPSDLDRGGGAAPLLVRWTDTTRTRLRIEWESTGAGEYRLFGGSLAVLRATGYDHVALACGLPAPNRVIVPDAGGVYYLAAAASCRGELSSTGRASTAAERPAPEACP